MSLEQELFARGENACELCKSQDDLQIYEVPEAPESGSAGSILVCGTCAEQLNDPEKIEPNHWRCLNDSMWSTEPSVQVVAYRMLHKLKAEGWPQDLLDMMYMEPAIEEWANAGIVVSAPAGIVHRDSNGNILEAGDSVVLIKDLKVKGSSMIAKQGTAVRRISLDHENEKYIEGKVDGQHIVIITDYVKKI